MSEISEMSTRFAGMEGIGTKSEPYLIKSLNDWLRIKEILEDTRDHGNEHEEDFNYFQLESDIDFNDSDVYRYGVTNENISLLQWPGGGADPPKYSAIILGNNHKIINLIDKYTGGSISTGILFSCYEIYNLNCYNLICINTHGTIFSAEKIQDSNFSIYTVQTENSYFYAIDAKEHCNCTYNFAGYSDKQPYASGGNIWKSNKYICCHINFQNYKQRAGYTTANPIISLGTLDTCHITGKIIPKRYAANASSYAFSSYEISSCYVDLSIQTDNQTNEIGITNSKALSLFRKDEDNPNYKTNSSTDSNVAFLTSGDLEDSDKIESTNFVFARIDNNV